MLVILKTTMLLLALLGATAAGAQPPDVSASPERAKATAPAAKAPESSDQPGFHDLICKPNGTEDGFDCADEATPAKIVPIPSQSLGPRPQDVAVSG
jgi:hypothetical protein